MVSFAYEALEIRERAAPSDAPLEVPLVEPELRGGWVNEARRAYDEAFGPGAWDRESVHAYPRPTPRASALRRLRLRALLGSLRAAFAFKAFQHGRRGTHLPGVAARGELTITTSPQFPAHPFFRPGRVFPCRLRHANASFIDDAGSVVRGAALKFADERFESPFDLPMNTGALAAFWNLESFWSFVVARLRCDPARGDWAAQREMMRNPAALIGTVDSVRDAPASYADLVYHSKIAQPFRGRDGALRLCRFRLLRGDLTRESGLPSPARQREIWNQARDPDDDRPTDYLRRELLARLRRAPVEYQLQLQLRDWEPARDTHETLNNNALWPSPWLELARLELTAPLADDEMESTRVWLGHQPEGLGVFAAETADDYRSLGHARVQVYPASQSGRSLRARLLGVPPFGDKRFE